MQEVQEVQEVQDVQDVQPEQEDCKSTQSSGTPWKMRWQASLVRHKFIGRHFECQHVNLATAVLQASHRPSRNISDTRACRSQLSASLGVSLHTRNSLCVSTGEWL